MVVWTLSRIGPPFPLPGLRRGGGAGKRNWIVGRSQKHPHISTTAKRQECTGQKTAARNGPKGTETATGWTPTPLGECHFVNWWFGEWFIIVLPNKMVYYCFTQLWIDGLLLFYPQDQKSLRSGLAIWAFSESVMASARSSVRKPYLFRAPLSKTGIDVKMPSVG